MEDFRWQSWQIHRITGGWCNQLYRATNSVADVAIKFTIRDKRDRASREYSALSSLQQAGLSLAPVPVLVDHDSYAQPVIVQTWLEGHVSATLPATEAEWERLVQHFALLHTLTPEKTTILLPMAVLNANNSEDGRQIVRQQVASIPREIQPGALQALIRRFEAIRFPHWGEVPTTLCRVDSNILNFIRRPEQWMSVDWENSGWGDPAFDIANLMTHIAYVDVSASQWDRLFDMYCKLVDDATAALRVQTYYKILLVWWVARLVRYLYEIPRGFDKRLAAWPPDWQEDLQVKYAHYLNLAESVYY